MSNTLEETIQAILQPLIDRLEKLEEAVAATRSATVTVQPTTMTAVQPSATGIWMPPAP